MTGAVQRLLLALLLVLTAGCGYRFVDPFPASDYALDPVRNATAEPGLASYLEEEMLATGVFRGGAPRSLSLVVVEFGEEVDSVDSGGRPVRQKLTMTVAWKVDGPESARADFGREEVSRTYPYSAEPVTLQWNRDAAVRLLVEAAARKILLTIGSPS